MPGSNLRSRSVLLSFRLGEFGERRVAMLGYDPWWLLRLAQCALATVVLANNANLVRYGVRIVWCVLRTRPARRACVVALRFLGFVARKNAQLVVRPFFVIRLGCHGGKGQRKTPSVRQTFKVFKLPKVL